MAQKAPQAVPVQQEPQPKYEELTAVQKCQFEDYYIDMRNYYIYGVLTNRGKQLKWRLCIHHMDGGCDYTREQCPYAHGIVNINPNSPFKTQLCKLYRHGCGESAKCPYAHGKRELRRLDFWALPPGFKIVHISDE